MSWLAAVETVAREWLTITWAVLWQSTLLFGLVWLMAWLLRNAPPRVRDWLWTAFAIKLLLMPLWFVGADVPTWSWPTLDHATPTASSAWPGNRAAAGPSLAQLLAAIDLRVFDESQPGTPVGNSGFEEAAERLKLETTSSAWPNALNWRHWPWGAGLALIWLSVIAIRSVWVIRQHARMRRVVREATAADSRWRQTVEDAASQLELTRVPELRITSADVSPFVWGLRQPAVVVPRWVIDELPEASLRAIVLHELAHVRRRDLLWVWVPELVRLVYFFHPVAHLVASRIRLERELACDQLALAHSGFDIAGYAETLISVLSRLSRPAHSRVPVTLLGLHSGAFWTRRMTMLENSGMRKLLPSRGLTLGLLIGCIIGLAIPTFVPRWLESRTTQTGRTDARLTPVDRPAPLTVRDPLSMGGSAAPSRLIDVMTSNVDSSTELVAGAAHPFGPADAANRMADTGHPSIGIAPPTGNTGVGSDAPDPNAQPSSTAEPGRSPAGSAAGAAPSMPWSPSLATAQAEKSSDELLEFLPAMSAAEDRIAKALDAPTELSFEDMRLGSCAESLQDMHNIPIMIDTNALQEAGLTIDKPVTLRVRGITARSALRILLTPLRLTYVVEDEVLKITSAQQAEARMSTRTYPVADLCLTSDDYQTLLSAIQRSVATKNWDAESGGEATIVAVERAGSLIVTQTWDGHDRILKLLRMLREAKSRMDREARKRGTSLSPLGGAGMGTMRGGASGAMPGVPMMGTSF